MLHTHAPVFGPPRKHLPADERAAEGPDAELPAAERASDAARTRKEQGGLSNSSALERKCRKMVGGNPNQNLCNFSRPTLRAVSLRRPFADSRLRVRQASRVPLAGVCVSRRGDVFREQRHAEPESHRRLRLPACADLQSR